ncbi:hypothetical protein ONZ45_g4748 [Pleurotus djamor]|nr:hypothetical protein ONZ45_g4748 [Pleurotus djamor]
MDFWFKLPHCRTPTTKNFAMLPGDLLLEITRFLDSRLDMLNLSLTSHQSYDSVTPALYSSVSLNSFGQCVKTLNMLSQRPDIARHVRSLAIHPEGKPGSNAHKCHVGLASEAVREIAASTHLDALSTFVWDGDELPVNDDMWFALRMFCPRLKYIYTTIGSILPCANSHLFDFVDLTGFSLTLKSGFFDNHVDMFLDEDQPASRKFWDMLINRCPNLEELSIDGISTLPTEAHSLVKGSWPRLRKLTLGDVTIDWQPTTDLDKRPFISFLEKHNALRSLSLSRHNIQPNYFAANPVTFSNLTDFSGTLEQLQALPHLHASLKSVTFRDPMQTRELTPLAVVSVLQSMTALTHLRISFVLHSMYDSGSLLRSLVQSCPHLRHLDLTCAHKPSFHLDSFAKTIRSFPKLRSLHLTIVKYPGDEDISAGAARIASTNPRLEEFTLKFLPPRHPLPLPFSLPILQMMPPSEATGTLAEKSLHADSDATSKLELPPLTEWRKHFRNDSVITRDRVSVKKPQTADMIAEGFVPEGSEGKVIIEAYPGPGALTRALMKLPKSRINKIIVLEDYEPYLEYLRPLEAADPRVTVIPKPGYSWDSYEVIQEHGLLDDVKTLDWSAGVHPQLQFITHFPLNIHGEQLLAQFLRGIPDHQWLFKYGRIPLSFLLSEYVWQVAVAQYDFAVPTAALSPFATHFHPKPSTPLTSGPRHHNKAENRKVGMPFQAINVTPLAHPAIQPRLLDKWDFCLRRLFVLKSKPLKQAISALAPGAQVLLKKLESTDIPPEDRVNVKTEVRKLSVDDWAKIIKAFDEWPFAPEDLAIADSFSADREKSM